MILQLPKNGKEGEEMKVKCDYCQQLVDETEKSCPNCGAPMPTANRTANEQPKTIEQLQEWYKARNLPPENVTRFFIGKDVKEARAFGIYKNSAGDFVVYKNKSDGSRAIRYQGADEEYAVNEIYQKLKVEITNQKANNVNRSAPKSSNNKKSGSGSLLSGLFYLILWALMKPIGIGLLAIIAGIIIAIFDHSPSEGYYRYQGNDYYYQDDNWYMYDDYDDSWSYATNYDFLDDLINDETDYEYRVYDHEGYSFEDSSYYDDDSSYSYSYDYDSSWDSDSSWDWDSGDSWDSWDSGSSWNSNW
jgi:hypothetical protein